MCTLHYSVGHVDDTDAGRSFVRRLYLVEPRIVFGFCSPHTTQHGSSIGLSNVDNPLTSCTPSHQTLRFFSPPRPSASPTLHIHPPFPATRVRHMSDSSETSWSNDPNAPKIPPSLHLAEKETFAGALIGAISYGTLIHIPAHPHSPRLLDPPFRHRHCYVLPMYWRVAQSHQPYSKGYEVGAHCPHCGNVPIYHYTNRDLPKRFIRYVHQ